ncbi:MAG TPA: hypothetical protein VGL46_09260 [Pseudonocardiaceae bacterium]
MTRTRGAAHRTGNSDQSHVRTPDDNQAGGNDEQDGEPPVHRGGGLFGLAAQAIASWGTTWRFLLVVVVITAVLVVSLLLLRVDVVLGPVRITGR